jgi:hypothetical protein
VTHGGRRPGSGRHCRDTVRVTCSIVRPAFNELVRLEAESGTYRMRVAAGILTEALVSKAVDRELAACPREVHGRNGSNGQGSRVSA